jgi:hypothetical protein
VYHHILLVWSWFFCLLFCIGGDAYFGSAFNSLVHFFMYNYYALALVGVPCPWKKHLTLFQMVQFVCCAAQSLYVLLWEHNLWWGIPALQLFVMANMLVLFSRFYKKKYNKKPGVAPKPAPVALPKGATSAAFTFDDVADPTPSPPPTFSTALINEPATPSDNNNNNNNSTIPSPSSSPAAENDAAAAAAAAASTSSPAATGAIDDEPVIIEKPKRVSSKKKNTTRSRKAD